MTHDQLKTIVEIITLPHINKKKHPQKFLKIKNLCV